MECLGLTMLNCGLQNVKLMLHVLNTKRGGGDMRKLLEVMKMFITLIVMMVSAFPHVQTH